ncbi:Bug family tripartite tricarboxylate transporter substrate binding protein [Variovorax saccharolyticus]|uniref:Bug family tripartite tricarboxylate transporter substrate binding protein n=1 Tax=Variovorax saccharolyticus TaxID=3053516 RepID=UPI00257512FF|nr:tripartite tricarboxylate transporter substrate binding protein [Variovorax sp. J31P216]MDM0024517.1 tripartite tricarboxylate transporter substrate binding protein [Variovorax sp. J31P216]
MNHQEPRFRRRTLSACALAALMLAAPAAALAQAWPSKPIKILVGFPPGGVADIMARTIAPLMSETLGQPVVVESRAGANGNVAADAVAKSPADGYTLALTSTGIESVNPFLFGKSAFDPDKDLAPVAATGRILLFLTTRPGLPANDVDAFVRHAKANPGKLSFGSAGSGSTPHLVGELFKQSAGIYAVHVPYRGAAPALQDLLASQIDFFFDPGISFANVRAGKLKMLAVASAQRSPLFPDVPTLAERGYKNMDYDTWFGLFAPAATPPEVRLRLNAAVNKALANEAVRNRFREVGGEATPMTPEAFKAVARKEAAVFSQLIKDRNIQAD